MAKLDDLRKERDTMNEAADAANRWGRGVKQGVDRAEVVLGIMEDVLVLEEQITKEKTKQAKLASTAGSNARKFKSIQDDVGKSTKETNKSWGSILQNIAKGNILEAISGKSAVTRNIAQKDYAKLALEHAGTVQARRKNEELSVSDYGKILDIQKGITDGSIKETDISEQMLQLTGKQGDILNDVEKDLRLLAEHKDKEVGVTKELEQAEERRAATAKKQNIVNAAAVGIFGVLYKLATQFAQSIDTLGKHFGSLTVYSDEFKTGLIDAGAESAKLGGSIEDNAQITSTLSSNFGLSLDKASGLSATVFETSKALGISGDEAANLFGTLASVGGVSTEYLESLTKGTFQLAAQSGVAPAQVMKDIAGSAETIAIFIGDTGDNLAKAAIQARAFGLNIDTIAKSARSMLDFQTSIESEIEASVLIGKQLNLQKARELGLNKDLVGFQKEIKNQLKGIGDFNDLNIFGQEALAKALGMSVAEVAKLANGTKELSLAGALATGSFEGVTGQAALSQLTKLVGEFKKLAITILNEIGPALMTAIGDMNEFLKSSEGIKTIVGIVKSLAGALAFMAENWKLVIAATLGIKATIAILAAWQTANLAATVTAAAAAAGQGSTLAGPAAPIVFPVILTALLGGIATILAGYGISKMSDGVVGPGGINFMSGPAGSFALNPRDSVLATTNPIPVNQFPAGGVGEPEVHFSNQQNGQNKEREKEINTMHKETIGVMTRGFKNLIDATLMPMPVRWGMINGEMVGRVMDKIGGKLSPYG